MKTRVSSRVSFLLRSYLMVVLAACLAAVPVEAQPGKAFAEKMVAESGFQGGLIVLVGGWDANLALSLGKAPNVLVHWLVRDGAELENARRQIRAAGVAGRVSVMLWEGSELPYADGMVNLLLLQHDAGPDISPSELARVLAPRGAEAQFRGRLRISPYSRKQPPEDVDEWTHSRHDATGNAVSKDRRVGPPRSIQWEALPRWNRGTKTSALVSAQGRIFYILDDAPFACETSTWSLIARDAYNGIRLWRHELSTWGGAKYGKKVGPAQVNRQLVAVGDRVYAPLGDGAPVSVLECGHRQGYPRAG
jgi:hypothetical protein